MNVLSAALALSCSIVSPLQLAQLDKSSFLRKHNCNSAQSLSSGARTGAVRLELRFVHPTLSVTKSVHLRKMEQTFSILPVWDAQPKFVECPVKTLRLFQGKERDQVLALLERQVLENNAVLAPSRDACRINTLRRPLSPACSISNPVNLRAIIAALSRETSDVSLLPRLVPRAP